jgi:cell division protein FtsB
MDEHGGRRAKVKRPSSPPRASDRGRSRLGDVTRPVVRDRRLATRRRTTVLLAIAAVGIAGALAAALFVLPVGTYFEQDAQIDQRSEQLRQISAVVDDLRSEVERLQTADGIREAARGELGFVEAGERRETVLDPTGVPTDLPEGWPYDLVEDIVDLRRNPPPPPTTTPPAPTPTTTP